MTKMKAQTKPKSQRNAFIDAARKIECDESQAAFEGKLKQIAKAKPDKKGKRNG